jgi:hypothetical protein
MFPSKKLEGRKILISKILLEYHYQSMIIRIVFKEFGCLNFYTVTLVFKIMVLKHVFRFKTTPPIYLTKIDLQFFQLIETIEILAF